jgi:hypothetical protein
MPRNITVQFSDGTTHVYQNAPDSLTPEQAEARARKDFPGKSVAGLDGGRKAGNKAPTLLDKANAFADRNINPVLMTFNRNALPFMDEAADGLQAASNLVQGRAKSPAEAWAQARGASGKAVANLEATRPKTAALTRGVGLASQALVPAGVGARAVAAAPSLGQAAVRSGVLGATAGGVSGYAAGEGRNRGRSAVEGAAVGGAFGGALPYAVPAVSALVDRASPLVRQGLSAAAPMVEGVGRAIPAVDDLAGNVAMRMRAMAPPPPTMAGPEQIALRHLSKTLQASGLSLDDLRNAPQGITAAEAMGPTGRRQIGALARMDGNTGPELEALVAGRASGRMGNLKDAFADATGQNPDAVEGSMEALLSAGRVKAAPLYDAAYSDTLEMTPTLREIVQRPAVQKGLREAREQMLNAGLDPDAQGLIVDPASGDIPIIRITKQPSLQVLDYAKRSIDDDISSLRDSLGTITKPNKANALIQTASELRDELTRQSDNYRQALETSGDYLRVNAAFKDASKMLFNGKESPRALAQRLSKMTDSEREALKAGVANHALTLVNTGKMKPGLFSAQGVQQKLRILLGDEQAGKLIQTAEVEAQKAAFERRYAPDAGSGTQPFMQGASEIDESTGAASDVGTLVIDTITNPVGALKRGGASLINYGVDRATQPGQIAARDAIGQLYLNDPRELAAYLEANPVNLPPPAFPGPRAPNPFAFTPRAPGSSPRPRSSR